MLRPYREETCILLFLIVRELKSYKQRSMCENKIKDNSFCNLLDLFFQLFNLLGTTSLSESEMKLLSYLTKETGTAMCDIL